jgi:uncharacterized membrane protein YoaK (UPF0700 family)
VAGAPDSHGSDDRWLFAGLFLLTAVTGTVDAACFLGLGRVFTGNMTGNVLLLGFATSGVPGLSFLRSLLALAAFIAGAFLGALLVGPRSRPPRYAAGFLAEWVLLAGGLAVVTLGDVAGVGARSAAIALLGVAMGVQNSSVRRMGRTDVNTLVLTTALGGLVAGVVEVGGRPVRAGRRVATVVLLFAGAALGAALERHAVGWALLGALVVATLAVLALARSGTLRRAGRPTAEPGDE